MYTVNLLFLEKDDMRRLGIGRGGGLLARGSDRVGRGIPGRYRGPLRHQGAS